MIEKKIQFNGRNLHFYLRDDADKSVFDEVFADGEYNLCRDYLKNLKSGVVLDIGGHAGFFTVWVKALNPFLNIIAYEPVLDNLAVFKKHLMINRIMDGVRVKNKGIAGETGRRKLYLSADSINHSLFSNGKEFIEIEVDGFTDLLNKTVRNYGRIDLIKLDAEGVEFEVFESIFGDVLSDVRAFIIEYHTNLVGAKNADWLVAKLKNSGFRVQRVPSKYSNDLGMLWAWK